MYLKLEAWQKCYAKLLSKNLSANVAQTTIIYGKNATKVICKNLTPYVP